MLILDWLNIVAVLVLFTKEARHISNPREYIGEPTVSSQGIEGAKMKNIKINLKQANVKYLFLNISKSNCQDNLSSHS